MKEFGSSSFFWGGLCERVDIPPPISALPFFLPLLSAERGGRNVVLGMTWVGMLEGGFFVALAFILATLVACSATATNS